MVWMPNNLMPGGLDEAEATELSARVAALAETGLPLETGLRAAAEELGGTRLSRALAALADELTRGRPFAEVIDSPAVALPSHVRALLIAAIASGRFPEALSELLRVRQSRQELCRQLWTSLAYPVILLGVLAAIFALFEGLIAPMFAKVYGDLEIPLPPMTDLALAISGPRAVYAVLATAGAIVLFGVAASLPKVRFSAALLYSIPLFGSVWRWHRQAEFAQLLAVMIEQNIPLGDAVALAGAASNDGWLIASTRKVRQRLDAGQPLAAALAASPWFAATLATLVDWGQQRWVLAESLRTAADLYRARARNYRSVLRALALPLTFFLIILFVAFFMISMYAPLINGIRRLT